MTEEQATQLIDMMVQQEQMTTVLTFCLMVITAFAIIKWIRRINNA